MQGVSLNKRKGSAMLVRAKRVSGRIPEAVMCSAGSRAQSSYRNGTTVLMSSLEPEFLALFASVSRQK